jgi:8-oxo-dGTP diphosphatase / 2-hydroxy-dATP diphosphatase
MNKVEKKETLQKPVIQSTSVFIVDSEKVLLGMKKRGFATGKWNGFGGKGNDGEAIEDTARREVREESDLEVNDLVESAVLNCHHPSWTQEVHVYTTSHWEGTLEESDEMRPQWFSRDEIPYEQMWEDAAVWLPMILNGQKLKATLYFDSEGKLLPNHEIIEVDSLN